jgi:hypothetical protein
MKTDDILLLAYQMYAELNDDQKSNADMAINGKFIGLAADGKHHSRLTLLEKSSPKLNMYLDLGAAIGDLIRACKCDIAAEETKKSGKKSQSAVIKSMVKELIKKYPAMPERQTTYTKDGKQYICTGVRCFKFAQPSMDVPISTEENPKIDIVGICEDVLKIRNYLCEDLRVETPDLGKLKAYYKNKVLEYKAVKRSDTKAIPFALDYVAYPAYQIIDILEVMPDAELYTTTDNHKGNLYARDDKGNEALICPIKWDGLMQKTEL